MRTKQLYRILNWFETYQPNLKDGWELYEKLIEEEQQELYEALENNDLHEVIDAIIDIAWVNIWYSYFENISAREMEDITWNMIEMFHSHIEIYPWVERLWDFIHECIEEVINSNYTKELNTQTEWPKAWKVIKGDKFKDPDFTGIIKKYNITLK